MDRLIAVIEFLWFVMDRYYVSRLDMVRGTTGLCGACAFQRTLPVSLQNRQVECTLDRDEKLHKSTIYVETFGVVFSRPNIVAPGQRGNVSESAYEQVRLAYRTWTHAVPFADI